MAIYPSPHPQLEKPLPLTRLPKAAPDANALLPDDDIDQLLNNLLQMRWKRFACQDADPLGMLFNDRAKQWTAGWAPQEQALFLIIWETDSWQNKPTWSLYRNGELLAQHIEGQSAMHSHCMTQLLESPQLPTLEPAEFVARLSDFRFVQEAPLATEQLRQTMTVFPELYGFLQSTLLSILETDLSNPEWPTLEVLKLHRVQHKNALLRIFFDALQQGRLSRGSDTERFNTVLTRLQQDYQTLGQTIQPLFQGKFQQAAQEFKTVQGYCQWRIQMLKAFEQKQPPIQTSV